MIIRKKNSTEHPMWIRKFEKKGFSRVRAIAEWEELADPACAGRSGAPTHCQAVIESQTDLDNLPETCYEIILMFDDGTYVELPISGFKKMFEIVPEGELTDAIFGN